MAGKRKFPGTPFPHQPDYRKSPLLTRWGEALACRLQSIWEADDLSDSERLELLDLALLLVRADNGTIISYGEWVGMTREEALAVAVPRIDEALARLELRQGDTADPGAGDIL